MGATPVTENPILGKMIGELHQALGPHLRSVVLYGSAARGDFQAKTSDFNLLVVLEDLEPSALAQLTPVFDRWLRKKQPIPRLFSPALIAESADVFPIEFLDIQAHHLVLHGEDPLERLEVQRDHLRLQCERELREKMMRLREGYIAAQARPQELTRLLTTSYTTFVALFRGCLHLLGAEAPVSNAEVVAAFCERAGLDRGAFEEVDRLKRGEPVSQSSKNIFARYYKELTRAVGKVDRFGRQQGGQTP